MANEHRKRWIILGAVIFAVLWAALVWPSLYRYDHYKGIPVRINRVTGASRFVAPGY